MSESYPGSAYLTPKQIEKIIELRKLYFPDNETFLWQQAKDKQKHNSTWQLSHYREECPSGKPGVGNQSISNSEKLLHYALKVSSKKGLEDKCHYDINNIDDHLLRATKRAKWLQNYIESKAPSENTGFEDNCWCVYFLHYLGKNKDPELGRGLLEIKDDNSVSFTNVGGLDSENYHAISFERFHNIPDGILIFNLLSRYKMRQLHIKAFCRDPDQEVMLAQFSTYEDNRLQNGNMIFHRIDSKKKKNYPPGLYSIFSNPSGFSKIKPWIKKFFAIKSQNYNRVFRRVTTSDDLETAMQEYNAHAHKKTWFLEQEPPKIFVAAPIEGAGSSFDEDLLNQIERDLNGRLKKFQVVINHKGDGYDEDNTPAPIANLKVLRTVRIFILIIDEMSIPSYSLVQLGWALGNCKYCILIHRENTISKRLEGFKKDVLYRMEYRDSLAEAWKGWMAKKLVNEILQKSPGELDGRR